MAEFQVAAAAGAGFLLAVLWFDLMFDVQLRRHPGERVPTDVLASITAYYGRVTTGASPMNRLVALVMVATLAALVAEIVDGTDPGWRGPVSLAVAVVAIGIAALRTVPAAVRLGRERGTRQERVAMARAIYRDHLICASLIAVLLVLQLWPS